MAQHQQNFQLPMIPVGRKIVSTAVQLKCGDREENVGIIVSFCQWVTPKALWALWPVNTPRAPGLFQNLSLDTRTFCCSVGTKGLPCSLYPRLDCCCGVMLGRVCRSLDTKAPAEVWSCPISLLGIWAAQLFNCWSFYQDHSSFLISSSLFCPFFKVPGACSAACSMLPRFCAGFAMLWINTAHQCS